MGVGWIYEIAGRCLKGDEEIAKACEDTYAATYDGTGVESTL